LSGELQVPANEETTDQEVVASTNDDNFLVQIMKQWRQNEHGVTNSEQTGVQQRVEQILEKELDTYFAYISGLDFVDLKNSSQVQCMTKKLSTTTLFRS
jgi:hypothetical protein